MNEAFGVILFDTYDVLVRRSPRYLEDELIESIDTASRNLAGEERFWRLAAKAYGLTEADIDRVTVLLAAKFCKNLDVWRHLGAWSQDYRLVAVHGGPARLLQEWQHVHDFQSVGLEGVATAQCGRSRDDPALYRGIAEQLGFPPRQCLLVDDERLPVAAAHDAGLGAYRFGTVHGLRAVLENPSLAFARPAS